MKALRERLKAISERPKLFLISVRDGSTLRVACVTSHLENAQSVEAPCYGKGWVIDEKGRPALRSR